MDDANLYRAMGNALTDGVDPSGLQDQQPELLPPPRGDNPWDNFWRDLKKAAQPLQPQQQTPTQFPRQMNGNPEGIRLILKDPEGPGTVEVQVGRNKKGLGTIGFFIRVIKKFGAPKEHSDPFNKPNEPNE
jgi:hypothetical protein